ncbi:MAG TPA: histidine ammonia-lyase [Thermoanaerobaculia bacterium]|nr:histidine ammonia-lyase [Thermoanaerobaculia bacterium]
MREPDHHAAVVLDGGSLTLRDLARLARDPRVRIENHPDAHARVEASRAQIERLVERYVEEWGKGDEGSPVLEYGVTTGFGEFKNIPVAPDQLQQLQRNLLLSHSAGAGLTADPDNPANYYEPDVVRAVLAVRLNAFLKGYSGVRPDLVRTVQAMLNRGIVPRVPIHGSVGSSGDLCPLSHLFVVLLGEGSWFLVREPADLGHRPREIRRGLRPLEEDLGMPPVQPSYKEGLALNNGTTFSTALLALAVHDAEAAADTADVACALSLEAVCGSARAFDARVHEARGQAGQIAVAAHLRELLRGSRLLEAAGAVQDVYSLRCAPAVHGAARDAIAYARRVAEMEINAATDNPLFFPADETPPWDWEFRDNWPEGYRGDQRAGYSAGNFHGEPVGMAADFLAIGVAELANISERRIQMLLDERQSRNLPANLIPCRGVNSGFMLAQYTAAGLVSENKVLTHPASVDSIPTSANAEDHNAMSTIAARKLRTVLRNVQAVLAIELLAAAQGVEWRVGMGIDPRTNGKAKPASEWEGAVREGRDFEDATRPERRAGIADRLGAGTRRAWLWVRELAPPMLTDRTLDGDILAVRAAVEAHLFVV